MEIVVRDLGGSRRVPAKPGQTVLQALQQAHIVLDAPCGGAGTCKKCRMLVADGEGTSYRLACQTPVADGMEVAPERNRAIDVSMGGAASRFAPDGAPGTYGIAVDVGTTTLVARLHDLHTGRIVGAIGRSNPQLAFGADVISRIAACGEGGLAAMEALLGDALVEMAESLLAAAGVDARDVLRAALAGNTTMQHIACGIDPAPIGVFPFEPPTLFGEARRYAPFERAGIADGRVYFCPCVAAYVGGDITAGLLATDALRVPGHMLFLDLGTNGEMALAGPGGIVCCATAAGPVFEGANVKYGMPAYPGAISRVRAKAAGEGGLSVQTIGEAAPIGICGTGLFDVAALLLRRGIVDETGRIQDDDEIDPGISCGLERLLAEEDGQPAVRLAGRICVTQKDVRSLQLAKSAVSSGVETMMRHAGVAAGDIASLLVAGGFGEYLDLQAAATVGIFPPQLAACAESVGNTAIEGASAVLVSAAARDEIARVAAACSYIELSTSAEFNERYVENMTFQGAVA